MIAVSFVWIVLFAIFLALGDFLLQVFRKVVDSSYNLSIINTFFIGLCVGQIAACSLSLFLPLNKFAFLAIILLVLIYWTISRKRLIAILKNIAKQCTDFPRFGKIFFLFIGLVILYHSSSRSAAPDEFLYHLQSMKWIQEYGMVKGLANLHTRFGFNSSVLSIFSLFSFQPDLKISFTPLNGLCLLVFAAWIMSRIGGEKNVVKQIIYTTALLVTAHFFAMELSSTSTDIIVNILILYIILNCFFSKNAHTLFLPLAILPVLCITLKLSSTPIIIVTLYVFWVLFKENKIRHLVFILGFAALVTIPWIIQNIILSGYVIFPFPGIDLFSFDWKVPVQIVANEKDVTYNWARGIRNADEMTSLFSWVPSWYHVISLMNRTIYTLSALSIIFFMFTIRKAKYSSLALTGCTAAILGSVFGFLTAPELRFSIGFVLSTIFILLLFLSQSKKSNSLICSILLYSVIATFSLFHIDYIAYKINELSKMEPAYISSQLVKPFPIAYAKGSEKFELVKVNNVELYIPINGLCYDFDLPCTPYITTNLEMRGENIGDGFRIKQ